MRAMAWQNGPRGIILYRMRLKSYLSVFGMSCSLIAVCISAFLFFGGSTLSGIVFLLALASSLFSLASLLSDNRSSPVKTGVESDRAADTGLIASDPVMEFVRLIREGNESAFTRPIDAEMFPGMGKLIDSGDVDGVIAGIGEMRRDIVRSDAVIRKLVDRLVTDCSVLLPLARSVMKSIPEKTEQAAFAVIERFMAVRELSSTAAAKAKSLRDEMESDDDGVSISRTAENTRAAVKKERVVVKELSRALRENREHLGAMSGEIGSGIDLLKNITEITERSKLIAFNMSIEAARLGDSGRGFKVIIAELHRLNEKTFDFSRQVSGLLKRLGEYNTILVESVEVKAGNVIKEVERGMDASESAVESLIGASARTQGFTREIADISEKIDRDLQGVLESLQFQDITRQMIEGSTHILDMLSDSLAECREGDMIRIDERFKKERFDKIRRKLVTDAKTVGEKDALMEVYL